MKAAEASIKLLLDEPLKETAELIEEAQAEYEGLYFYLYSSRQSSVSCSHILPEFIFKYTFFLTILSTKLPDSKLHNLLSLAAKDLEIIPSPELSGSNLLLQHQKLILEHFGHKNTTILPGDVIQCLLLRVHTLTFLSLSTKFSRFSRQVFPRNTQNWFTLSF